MITESKKQLSKEAGAWWDLITEGYELDDTGLLILINALTAFDRMRQAQEIIKDSGVLFEDRFGQVKQHPACLVERDNKQTMLRNLKALGLERAVALPEPNSFATFAGLDKMRS